MPAARRGEYTFQMDAPAASQAASPPVAQPGTTAIFDPTHHPYYFLFLLYMRLAFCFLLLFVYPCMCCMYEGESIGHPAQGRPAGRDPGVVSLVQTSLLPSNHGYEIVAPVFPTNIRYTH